MKYQAGVYELRWSESVKAEVFDALPDYHGVSFYDGAFRYDVVVNTLMGLRLHITRTDVTGFLQDMPFHRGTAGLLPAGVEVSTPR